MGRSRVPAWQAANRFFPPRSIIAEAASRMRHNYAVVLGTRAMKKIRPIRWGTRMAARLRLKFPCILPIDWTRDAVCCLNLEEVLFGSSYLGYVL